MATMSTPQIVLIFNLLQDVNVLRPLAYLAYDDFNIKPLLFITSGFKKRDRSGTWQSELKQLQDDTCGEIVTIDTPWKIWSALNANCHGIIITSSESDLSAHRETHSILRSSPSNFITLTLQHGYECVGFLMNRNHKLAHGNSVGFAADIICTWSSIEHLRDSRPLVRSRIVPTGPSVAIKHTQKRNLNASIEHLDIPPGTGIVCENLHSPRYGKDDQSRHSFMDQFFALAAYLKERNKMIALRPHPGGQYTIKKEIQLPSNVILDNRPAYKVDWKQYAYGISAPSSVVFDMTWDDIPVCLWRDSDQQIDTTQLRSFPVAERTDELIAFACFPSLVNYTSYSAPLATLYSIKDKAYEQFTMLFKELLNIETQKIISRSESIQTERFLIVAPDRIPTVQLSFLKPLGHCDNPVEHLLWTGLELYEHTNQLPRAERPSFLDAKIRELLNDFRPSCIIFCRCFRADTAILIEHAKALAIPTVYHIDDDLLNPSLQILGPVKYKAHSDPKRMSRIREYLESVDLIYTSTLPLSESLQRHGVNNQYTSGKIYCSASKTNQSLISPLSKRIGYMGFGHAADFELIAKPIRHIMIKYPDIILELFGTIEVPKQLNDMGERITVHGPIKNYDDFLDFLQTRQWIFGLAPLVDEPFNVVKANTKWVEYTSCGIPTIASAIKVYKECCAGECGLLCKDHEQWISAMQLILDHPEERQRILRNAQNKVARDFSLLQHQKQILEIAKLARHNLMSRVCQ
jgi:glycosyltransferase involved in cell wall biosynthesis